jgi:AcrR family transcriptional regulator
MSDQIAVTPRRELARAATTRDILSVARDLLVSQGSPAVTLRAIAREMGMTAPSLYRYYANHHQLMETLIAELYHELAATMEAAAAELPADDLDGRLITAARSFRQWAIHHKSEFGLLFGSPLPNLEIDTNTDSITHRAGSRFGAVFQELFVARWSRRPFPIPDESTIDPVLVGQLRHFVDHHGLAIPLGAAHVFLTSWIRLYGVICMEVFGHLYFAIGDADPVFDAELQSLAQLIDIDSAAVRSVPPTTPNPSTPSPSDS